MKKDKEWLKKEINKVTSRIYGADFNTIKETDDLINQLDEPEVTLDKAFGKVAERYFMTKGEIWRHLEWLEAHGGKATYGEPEALSQEWIDEHAQGDYDEWVYTEDLQNLLVPKQEEVDQAYKDGYEKGKEYTFYKGYLEGLADKNV